MLGKGEIDRGVFQTYNPPGRPTSQITIFIKKRLKINRFFDPDS